ncbi:MAG TPA: chemotaxis-specific protein-glutamate methyltransferase CheB [Xanthobacteraceae bacterium]|jgi:two-component system chemotaxis response regulator CheB|nr:chemotaxis-specific protein-glutamate methyltransferase CheB [Xanthobacteraceae bacterium]
MIKLLIADDSALMRKLLGDIFVAEGDFDIRFARNGKEALDLAKSFQPDVVTLDVHMPEMNGLDCLNRIMIESPRPVVMVSSLTDDGAQETLRALDLGAIDFVTKPAGPVSLEIDTMRPLLVETIRTAARAKLRKSLRLRDRVRHRMGQAKPAPRSAPIQPAPRRAPEASPAEAADHIPGLILIGASTGGPPAVEAVISKLPRDLAWPVLVAQHLPASFTGAFARRLDGLGGLRVVEVVQPTPLAAMHVYIGRGDADILVAPRPSGPIVLSAPPAAEYPWHPSVERMVRSALAHFPAAGLVGVMLTGMGSDGAPAMTRLKQDGGRTIAEAESSAVVWGMPGELVKHGGADMVLPLGQIASAILEMIN